MFVVTLLVLLTENLATTISFTSLIAASLLQVVGGNNGKEKPQLSKFVASWFR